MSQANAERMIKARFNPPPFRIRAAQLKDLSEIVTVLLTSFYAQMTTNQWLYWIMRIGIKEDIKTRIRAPTSQYACLVATTVLPESAQSGVIVGTAELSQRTCETWQLFPPKRAYLSNLAVRPAYRQQGAAQQLLLTCENIALDWGFRHIYLHVMADNQAARRLYKQAGYCACEVSNPVLSGLGLRPQRLLMLKRVGRPQIEKVIQMKSNPDEK